VRKFSGGCKFTNCGHLNEPECAMRQAVSDGKLNVLRFENYLRMIEEFLNPK
jgi:ribosome biogenesis GTPase